MKSLTTKIIACLSLSYIMFMILNIIISGDAKFVSSNDLRTGEDWFYLLWLFGIPILVDLIVLGIPIFLAIRVLLPQKFLGWFLIILGFALNYYVSYILYGQEPTIYKVGLNLIFFMIFFGRKLFLYQKSISHTRGKV